MLRTRWIGLALIAWTFSAAAALAGEQFVPVGELRGSRSSPAAVQLADGRVLFTGGTDPSGSGDMSRNFPYADTYDPFTGQLSAVAPMTRGRAGHTMALLLDGRVLALGGLCGFMCADQSAEIYDPATDVWTPTGSMLVGRFGATATTLPDGRVLVAGGGYGTSTAELYDPASGTFELTAPMSHTRRGHTATLLPNGRALVAGGWDNSNGSMDSGPFADLEMFDPVTRTFANIGTMTVPRGSHSATVLDDGTVLFAGGLSAGDLNSPVATAEVFDPGTGASTPVGSMTGSREGHAAVRLGDGRVLVHGGATLFTGERYVSEVYDPRTRSFSPSARGATEHGPTSAIAVGPTSAVISGGSRGRCCFVPTPLVERWESRPAVVSTYPADGATSVSTKIAAVTVAFDVQVSAGPGLGAISVLFASGDGPVTIAVGAAVYGDTLVLTPLQALPANKTIVVSLPADAVVDAVGAGLAAPFTFAFSVDKK